MKISIDKIKRGLPISFGICLMVIVNLIPEYSLDILLTLIIILISLGIYFYSKKSNYTVLLKVLSVYIFINFLVFPFLYLLTLKYDTNSFKIENDIVNNEKRNSLTELKNIYKPKELSESIEVLRALEFENSEKLNIKISNLNSGCIIETEKYLLSKDCVPIKWQRPMYGAVIKICNKEGTQLASILDLQEGCMLTGNNLSISNYLQSKKQYLTNRLKEYSNEEKDITSNGDFWSFNQIITYSANTFSTSNLIPISRIANIFYYLHFFIGNGILLTILIAFIQKTIEKTKET